MCRTFQVLWHQCVMSRFAFPRSFERDNIMAQTWERIPTHRLDAPACLLFSTSRGTGTVHDTLKSSLERWVSSQYLLLTLVVLEWYVQKKAGCAVAREIRLKFRYDEFRISTHLKFEISLGAQYSSSAGACPQRIIFSNSEPREVTVIWAWDLSVWISSRSVSEARKVIRNVILL